MRTLYCGLDAHSSTCTVAVMDKSGEVCEIDTFPTSEQKLVEYFCSLEGKLEIHLEQSDLAGWIRFLLLENVPKVKEVVASNPRELKWISEDPRKSDTQDAVKLAEYKRIGRIEEVYYPEDKDLAFFKKTVQHHQSITEQQAGIKRRIKSRLRVEGIITQGKAVYSKNGRKLVFENIEDDFRLRAIKQLYQHLDQTLEIQEKALRLMKEHAKKFPIIKRLQQIPGIGLILACRFVGYIQNPHRFGSKSKLWAYCKLAICRPTSNGKPLKYKTLDSNGNGNLKDLSRTAFRNSTRKGMDNGVARFYRASLKRTQNEDHARLNTQRKLLAVMWSMWKKGTNYDDKKMG